MPPRAGEERQGEVKILALIAALCRHIVYEFLTFVLYAGDIAIDLLACIGAPFFVTRFAVSDYFRRKGKVIA